MTGFARAQAESDSYNVDVEVRSVNHRYLELRVKVPGAAPAIESKVRDYVTSRVVRGKVDLAVQWTPKGQSAFELEIDRPLLHEVAGTARELGAELGLEGGLRLADLMGFGRAFTVKEKQLEEGDAVWTALGPALVEAMDAHDRMRLAEGTVLEADLMWRLETMTRLLEEIETLSSRSRDVKRQDLLGKIGELEVASLEPSVLAMEVARLVERSDIAEEITRFRSHLSLWKDTVAGEAACGKKLDFIAQEMGREANTIGSKCQDAKIAERVIALKSELERIREQVQNIE